MNSLKQVIQNHQHNFYGNPCILKVYYLDEIQGEISGILADAKSCSENHPEHFQMIGFAAAAFAL